MGDSPDDIECTLKGFKEGNPRHELSAVEDGIEAIKFLRRQGKYADASEPDVVLLDLICPARMVARCFMTSVLIRILSIYR